MARDCTMVHYPNTGRNEIFFEDMQHKSFGVLLFIILNMSFKTFLDQMGSRSLRAFPDLSAGMNVINRVFFHGLEGSERLKKFSRFEEKRDFIFSLLDRRIWMSGNPKSCHIIPSAKR
jgi:hypothetical protein